jgi:hypothetical protein
MEVMFVPSLNTMFQLWSTRGAQLRADRSNGHSKSIAVVREVGTNLLENIYQVSTDTQLKNETESHE